jgi:acyl-CoA synthetase (NDP forming)
MELAELHPETVRQVAAVIPPFGVSSNPIDVTMEVTVRPGMMAELAGLLLEDAGVDALLIVLTTNADPPAFGVAQGLVELVATAAKPIVVARVGAETLAPRSMALYREAGVPVFPMPDRAVRVLRAVAERAELVTAAERKER